MNATTNLWKAGWHAAATLMILYICGNSCVSFPFPRYFFITGHEDEFLVMEWFGSIETFTDIYHTGLHCWYRWNYSTQQDSVLLLDRRDEMNAFLATHVLLARFGTHRRRGIPTCPLTNKLTWKQWLLVNDDGQEIPLCCLSNSVFKSILPEIFHNYGCQPQRALFQSRYCTELLPNAKEGSNVPFSSI